MKRNLKKRLFVGVVIGFGFILFNSLGFASDNGGISQKEQSRIENPETVVKTKNESLANHSTLKRHGQKYSYRYYPDCAVYYDINRRLYFYPENDSWKIFAILPNDLKSKLDHYVEIEMTSDKPYTDNEEHVKKLPPKDSKKSKKGMWSKLIFFLFYDHAAK